MVMSDLVETVSAPRFRPQDFARANKKPGLTALVCLHNEEAFGAAALESIVPFFDEIIIVYHECTDATPEIVAAFAAKYRGQVRAFHYVPHVHPLGSRAHRTTPPSSVHSLVHYFNFTLSKASYQICCRWDGDQIADPASFGEIVKRLRALKPGTLEWWLSPWRFGYWYYTGVNLWSHDGELLVRRARPLIGRGHDHSFFPANLWVRYKRFERGEYLFKRALKHTYVGCLFYHLKGVKTNRGLDKYYFDQNPDSLYKSIAVRDAPPQDLITLDELRASEPTTRQLADPAALGIYAVAPPLA